MERIMHAHFREGDSKFPEAHLPGFSSSLRREDTLDNNRAVKWLYARLRELADAGSGPRVPGLCSLNLN